MYYEPNPDSQRVVECLAESLQARHEQLCTFYKIWNEAIANELMDSSDSKQRRHTLLEKALIKWYVEELRTLRADAAEIDNMIFLKGLKKPTKEERETD